MSPDTLTAADLRAKAKALRREAKALDEKADEIDAEAASAHRRATSRAAHEARAATMCRPIWASEGLDGVYAVLAVEDGCFMLRNLLAVGGLTGPHPYRCRDGRYAGSAWVQTADAVRRARLDHVATMLAWREWCATRKSAEVPDAR